MQNYFIIFYQKIAKNLKNIFRNPNNPDDDYIGVPFEWKPYGAERNYLNLGDELIMSQNLFIERFKIWDKLFPLEKYLEK